VSESEALAEIRRVLAEELGVTQAVEPATELMAGLALDSMQIITLVVSLEDRYRIKLDEQDASDIRTVAQLAARVAERSAHPEST
jgi:acyl carrier protein